MLRNQLAATPPQDSLYTEMKDSFKKGILTLAMIDMLCTSHSSWYPLAQFLVPATCETLVHAMILRPLLRRFLEQGLNATPEVATIVSVGASVGLRLAKTPWALQGEVGLILTTEAVNYLNGFLVQACEKAGSAAVAYLRNNLFAGAPSSNNENKLEANPEYQTAAKLN